MPVGAGSVGPKGVASEGRSFPLGATVVAAGVNFSVYARDATGVELAFFDREDDAKPSRVIKIDPNKNRTYPYWHVFVPGLETGAALRVPGFRAVRPRERYAV